MDELQKWIELAHQNFSDNNFFVWFNATKAFKDFQNSNLPLTQDSYKAQLAIINGLLINYLDLSDNKILQTSKIAYMILHLDQLILKAESIAGMNDGLNCLAKCLLYMRTGDYILGLNSSNAMFQSKAQKQAFLAIHSYCRAHQWACQHWNRHMEYSDPLLLVCLLELKILIEKNWDEAFDRKMNVYNDNDLLFTLLNNVAHGQFKEENSFMLTDKTILMKKNNFQKFNTNFVDLVMEKAHKLRGNVNFLRQFVWILANNSSYFEQNNYKFLNKFYPNLPECPVDPHNAGSPETFSLIDIKLFLYRLTRHLKCISPRDDTILLPWLFYQNPTGSQQQFWKAMNRFLDLPNDCSELQLLMEIEKGLEQIRVPPTMSGPTAVESALCTIKFVKQMLRMMPENADRKAREFCHILMQRYSEAIGGEEIPESDWVLVVEQSQGDGNGNGGVEQITLQPKIEFEEEFGNEPSEIVQQEEQNEKKDEHEQQTKTVKTNSSISTQTDNECEKPQEIGENTQLQQQNALLLQQQDWRIRRDLGEVDFHINRWVQHNKALRTLFI